MPLYYPQPEGTTIFRPDSRNGSKDFYIDRTKAKELFSAGIISGDLTNGGYMPNDKTPNPYTFRATYEVKTKKSKPKRSKGERND